MTVRTFFEDFDYLEDLILSTLRTLRTLRTVRTFLRTVRTFLRTVCKNLLQSRMTPKIGSVRALSLILGFVDLNFQI